ncbi:MAG: Maf-like protein [Paracoccaceae bacterium]|nr:MAG: septum formation protein Maf [Alphaproteobacteria bacterium]GIX12273.1 MAG: Maf-like protein [Paracoccaceae bacterium]
MSSRDPSDLVLASASSARARLLAAAGLSFRVSPAAVDEAALKSALLAERATPRDIADKLAETKAVKVSRRCPGALVIGADQVLAAEGRLFDKPRDRAAAADQLRALRGRTHRLLSAAVIARDGAPLWRHVGQAELTMRAFSDAFIESYLDAEGDGVLQSVGAYRIEGRGVQLFSRVRGDLFTIQGMPLIEMLDFLRHHGICAR